MRDKPLYVTRPSLPPLDEFVSLVESVWDSGILSNCGPLHERLERELAAYLDVEHVSLFANGTLALITALRALRLEGQVITTPFSFVATAHSLLWNGLEPVFADIEPTSLNLAPTAIEAAITNETSAILPVHCYGNSCDVDAISKIAGRHDLAVVYDAAHAFGVRDAGGSLLRHGDMAVMSFHATKVFNTFEGGAVISSSAETKERLDSLRNFGFAGHAVADELGLNAKMSEISAAMGLAQLRHMGPALEARRQVADAYREMLSSLPAVSPLSAATSATNNNSYFPVMVNPAHGRTRDALFDELASHSIYARRYFYPLISTMPVYHDLPSASSTNLPIATEIAEHVLCLPISSTMTPDDCRDVVDVIARFV